MYRFYVLLLMVPLASCATGPYEWKYGQDKIVPGQFSMTNTDTNGTVLTWPSHAVAAIVYPGGGAACIQSAQSSKARNMSGGGGVTANVSPAQNVDAKISQAITEAVAAIQDRNDVATFLDVALFQICSISKNKNFSNDQTVALIQQALVTSADIAKYRPDYSGPTLEVVKPDGAILTPPSAGGSTSAPSVVPIPTTSDQAPDARSPPAVPN